jgi:Na+/H+-dicarboxylate symporter
MVCKKAVFTFTLPTGYGIKEDGSSGMSFVLFVCITSAFTGFCVI